MREIKFRAWDIDGKRMVYGEDALNAIPLAEVNPEITIMQYTGLKDSNGKEIYEGDIVRDFVSRNHNSAPYEIKWDINCFNVQRMSWLSEVIGNQFENPELLKGGGTSDRE